MKEIRTVEDISKEDWSASRARIKEAGGKAILLVHPFFVIADKKYRMLIDAANKKYRTAVERLLTQSKTPVIILEERKKVEETRKRLRKLKAPTHLILPTALEDTALVLKTKPRKDRTPRQEGIDEMVRRLKKLGVKKIFVGGATTYKGSHSPEIAMHEKQWLPPTRQPSRIPIRDGCAGFAYLKLIESGQFERVRLMSGAIFPEKPTYKRKPKPTRHFSKGRRKPMPRQKMH